MKKYSVVIANRHQTSISLEPEFYAELVNIAKSKNITINQLITQIDASRQISNLSSALRVYVLEHLKSKIQI